MAPFSANLEQDGLGLGKEGVSRYQLHGEAQELRQGDRFSWF